MNLLCWTEDLGVRYGVSATSSHPRASYSDTFEISSKSNAHGTL